MNIIVVGIIAYILLQLFLGFYISKFIKSESDYLLGGRKLGYFLTTFSIFATWFGAESCIGTAGTAYQEGLSGVKADPFGYGLVLILMGLFFAIPLYKMKLTTIADFFNQRYSENTSKVIALIMIPTSILWGAAQIRAFGLILSSFSDLTVEISILISAIIVITYTVFGGLLADAWTDLIQGSILIIGLLFISFLVFFNGAEFREMLLKIPSERLSFNSASDQSFHINLLSNIEAWAIPICGSLIAQEMVSRVFSAKNHKVAQRSSLIAGTIYILIGLIPLSLGLIGLNMFPNLEHPEQILPMIAKEFLSPMFYVIFIGALISAILSTVDSALLSSSALLSHNIVFPSFKIKDENKKLKISRINVVLAGVVAYLLATKADGVYELVKDASAFGSSGIFIAFIFGLIGKFGNGKSAISSVVVGSLAWFISYYIYEFEYSYVLSLMIALIVFVIVGFLEIIFSRTLVKN
ncbi:MAG: sodium:solute symporter family protein [Ignavibacterium sp.]|nr:sodium:solute symporter family protein [Ignavibacterium sp.]MDW8376129.1 sodium:solute symporter family protein [Ignavibacteriales bacterium]